MANPDVTFVVEKSEEKAACDSDSESYSCSDTTVGESSLEEWQISRKKKPMMIVKILELFHWILAKWKKMFATSCVFAVSLDPLFLYIPFINQEMNCLSLDQNLKITVLALRSVTDLFYIVDIIIEIYTSGICSSLTNEFHHSSKLQFLGNTFLPKVAKTIWQSYILIDILAIIPLPQVEVLFGGNFFIISVLILTFFSKMMRASRSLDTRKFIMNFFVLMQYLPRVIRIYLSCKAPKMSHKSETPIWIKGVLNFFMYILASHVLGAVWYFFAIQQMTLCWAYACRNENGCDSSTFGCHDRTSKNDLCPVSSPNTTLFEFGIFLSLLQSGVPSSTNFLQKFTNCFCWGLRNLSSLGSNLQPSTNTWENLFVVFISIIGLLLFLYLIGNLQTYLSLDTSRIEAHRHKMKIKRKMEEKGLELELWLPKNGIPEKSHKNVKLQIMEKVEHEFEENRDVDLDNFLSILPSDLQNQIKSYMPLTRLKKVRVFQNMDEQVLKAICRHLKPIKYTENNLILREGEPLKMMLFIVEGLVAIEKKGGSILNQGASELYGEKLLAWPFSTSFPMKLPTATESATAIGDVEALILMADDLKGVVFKFGVHFIKKYVKLKEKLANHLKPVDTTPTSIGAAPASVEVALRLFTAKELKKATQNYNESTIIGEGGYGTVYRGILPDKTVVAIKKSKIHAPAMSANSVNEAFILSRITHRNIVKLLGCCLEAKTNLIVYEFMDNGTLYEHIHNVHGGEQKKLSFEVRLKIAAEIAGALSYLHLMSIVHGDVKSQNILLDQNYTAKVSDLGSSRSLDEDQDSLTTLVQGTFGYLDPEYFRSSKLTVKSDVYSFGVVLLELLTSRKAICFQRQEEERNLASFFIFLAEQGHIDQILDGEITNGGNYVTAEKVSYLARSCLNLRGVERPSMKEVATKLELIMEEHRATKANFSMSSEDTNNWFLRSPSNSYVVNVRDEGGDVGSSGSINICV